MGNARSLIPPVVNWLFEDQDAHSLTHQGTVMTGPEPVLHSHRNWRFIGHNQTLRNSCGGNESYQTQ